KTMKRHAILHLSIALTILVNFPASGWGPQGHQAVAETARGLLTEKTRAAIIKILENDDLAAIATWSDEVREAARGKGPLLNDPEVIQFNKKFPHNDQWHYVNLPLATPE